MDLSIIIVSYNTKDLLENYLFSIYQNSDKLNLETTVIDNVSRDGSVEIRNKTFPKVKLIENAKNVGFACGLLTTKSKSNYPHSKIC
jgi:GT2 family glycosyltransferase